MNEARKKLQTFDRAVMWRIAAALQDRAA